MTKKEVRIRLNAVIKFLQQIDKDLVLDEEEKEALIDDAYGFNSYGIRETILNETASGNLTIRN